MFPLPALITREPRPAEWSVARRPGIVFTISGRFRHAAVVNEPKAAGAGAGLRRPIGYEIRRKSYISSLKSC